MSDEKPQADYEWTNEVWPRKLNKALIGVGFIAFGLIVADRLINTFRPDNAAEPVVINRSVESPVDKQDAAQLLQDENDDVVDPEVAAQEKVEVPQIEDVFGSRLVFVSVSEPMYVVTGDEQRFDVGASIDDDTILAGVTGQRVILERDGELLVLSLPEPQAN